MRGDDAVKAIEAGGSAILVSNHGARQLDGVPPTVSENLRNDYENLYKPFYGLINSLRPHMYAFVSPGSSPSIIINCCSLLGLLTARNFFSKVEYLRSYAVYARNPVTLCDV